MDNIKVDPYVRGEGHLLKHARDILYRHGYEQVRNVSDFDIPNLGVFSIEYTRFFLNANAYKFHGTTVSIQKNLVKKAAEIKKGIVVYVAEDNKFYEFDPQKILENSWENIRIDPRIRTPDNKPYGHAMLNWNVDIGGILQL